MHHGRVSPEIAAGLLILRERVEAAKIPPSKLDESINIAVWNIREFGRVHRTEPAIHYIAEILGQFDLMEWNASRWQAQSSDHPRVEEIDSLPLAVIAQAIWHPHKLRTCPGRRISAETD